MKTLLFGEDLWGDRGDSNSQSAFRLRLVHSQVLYQLSYGHLVMNTGIGPVPLGSEPSALPLHQIIWRQHPDLNGGYCICSAAPYHLAMLSGGPYGIWTHLLSCLPDKRPPQAAPQPIKKIIKNPPHEMVLIISQAVEIFSSSVVFRCNIPITAC